MGMPLALLVLSQQQQQIPLTLALCKQPQDTLSGSKKIRKMHKGQLYMGRLVHPFTRWEKEAPPSSGTRKVTRDRDGRIRARDHLPRGFLSRKGRISVALAKK